MEDLDGALDEGLHTEAPPGLRGRFIGGAKWVLVGSAAGRGLSLVGTVLVTRLLIPAEFGELSLVQAWISFFAGLAGLGLSVAITKGAASARATNTAETGQLIGFGLKITALSGAAAAVIVLLARGWLGVLLGGPQFGDLLALGCLAIAAGAVSSATTGALAGLEAFRSAAVVMTTRSVATAILMVAGASVGGAAGGLAGWSVGECLAAGISVLVLTRRCRLEGVPIATSAGATTWRTLRRVGYPSLAATVSVTFALAMGQRLLAQGSSGLQHVAEFNVSYRWSLVILFVPASLAPVLLPMFANLRASQAMVAFVRLLRANLWLTAALTVPPAAMFILFRDTILGLSGDAYLANTATFVILMIATVPTALNSVLSQAAVGLDRIRLWLISDLALALTIVLIAWVVIPDQGSTGLAWAYVVGYAATCLVLAIPLQRRIHAS